MGMWWRRDLSISDPDGHKITMSNFATTSYPSRVACLLTGMAAGDKEKSKEKPEDVKVNCTNAMVDLMSNDEAKKDVEDAYIAYYDQKP